MINFDFVVSRNKQTVLPDLNNVWNPDNGTNLAFLSQKALPTDDLNPLGSTHYNFDFKFYRLYVSS